MSPNLQYFAYVVVLLIFLHVRGTSSSNLKSVLERLKYLEIRINSESKFRDEDFLEILERLDQIDKKLNKTLEKRTNIEENDKTDASEYFDVMEYVNDGYRRIRKAFKEEKYENERIRRQIPRLENNITSIQQDLQKYCSTSLAKTEKIHLHVTEAAESVKSEILKNIEKAKSSLQETVHESAREVGNQSDVSREIENVKLLITKLSNNFENIFILMPESCLDVRNIGKIQQQNGVYTLRNNMKVYCDHKTDGGGWTVFQRRINGAVDFYKTWDEYKAGFGDLDGEFWLGNEILSTLTTSNYDHELRVDMEDFEGNKAFAKYNKFRIHTEDDLYRLEVSGYSGNAGDSLGYHNGMPFTTYDRDNDKYSLNCAKEYLGAWWYNHCHNSNLNGKYLNEAGKMSDQGISWYHWKSKYYCLKSVEMKFR